MEVRKGHKQEAKPDEESAAEEEQEAPVPIVTHINNILHFFPNVEVYVNNQQIYNSNGYYARKSYISNKFTGAIFQYKEVLHCEWYDYEESLNEIIEAPLSSDKNILSHGE